MKLFFLTFFCVFRGWGLSYHTQNWVFLLSACVYIRSFFLCNLTILCVVVFEALCLHRHHHRRRFGCDSHSKVVDRHNELKCDSFNLDNGQIPAAATHTVCSNDNFICDSSLRSACCATEIPLEWRWSLRSKRGFFLISVAHRETVDGSSTCHRSDTLTNVYAIIELCCLRN